MKNKLFASVPNILFGVLIAIAPQTFAHACTGHDMPGACHYSQQAATGIGVVILVLGVVALFVNAQVRIGLNIAAIANALLLLAVPDRHLQGRHDALPHGHAAHAYRARRTHSRIRRCRHLARFPSGQALNLTLCDRGPISFQESGSGLAYCNRTIIDKDPHRAIAYRIARPAA